MQAEPCPARDGYDDKSDAVSLVGDLERRVAALETGMMIDSRALVREAVGNARQEFATEMRQLFMVRTDSEKTFGSSACLRVDNRRLPSRMAEGDLAWFGAALPDVRAEPT